MFDLFDDVILLRSGCVLYHGPRTSLPSYIRGLGFLPPDLHEFKPQSSQTHVYGMAQPSGTDFADWVAEWLAFPALRHRKDTQQSSLSSLDGMSFKVRASELL